MIDNPKQTVPLLTKLSARLPIETRLNTLDRRSSPGRTPGASVPERCVVIDVHYGGDEGGILCQIDAGDSNETPPFYASLTHLDFDRQNPLAREILGYRKHRKKKRLRVVDAFGPDIKPRLPPSDKAARGQWPSFCV